MENRQYETGEQHINTFFIPVEELARNNPQTAIPNPTSYSDMATSFARGLYDSIKIAAVETPSGKRWLIIDGHTKTKFAIDYGNEVGITELEVYDATHELLLNPRIADYPKAVKDTLSMTEYLRAVIAPTKEHREIASIRIAAHIVQGWEATIGPTLSQKLSATGALSILDSQSIHRFSDVALERSLSQIGQFLPDETPEERQITETALIFLNSVIRDSNLRVPNVYQEILQLVARQDPVIGGEPQATREILGLLSLKAINQKIINSAPNDLSAQLVNQQILTQSVITALYETTPDTSNAISQALLDPSFSLENTIRILNSDNIPTALRETKIQQRQDTILKQLTGLKLSDEDLTLVRTISKMNLTQQDLKTAAEAILSASQTVDSIPPETQTLLEELIDKLYQSQTHHQLMTRTRALKNAHQNTVDTLEEKQIRQDIRTTVETHFASNSDLISPVIQYLYNFHLDDLPNATEELLDLLGSLDKDSLTKVLNGNYTLDHALSLLRKSPVSTSDQTPVIHETRAALPPEVAEHQNHSLSITLKSLLANLRENTELGPNTISEENIELVWTIIQVLANLVQDHQNIEKLITEIYPNLLAKVTRLQEELTQRDDY